MSMLPRPSKRATTLPKKPDTPHANDNTSSRTAQTPQKAAPMPQTSKSNANATSESPTIHKPLINATADRPPPRYLSMKIHVIVSLSPKRKRFARILYNSTDYTKIRATNSSLSPTVHEQSPRNSLSRTRHPPLTFWYSEEA